MTDVFLYVPLSERSRAPDGTGRAVVYTAAASSFSILLLVMVLELMPTGSCVLLLRGLLRAAVFHQQESNVQAVSVQSSFQLSSDGGMSRRMVGRAY